MSELISGLSKIGDAAKGSAKESTTTKRVSDSRKGKSSKRFSDAAMSFRKRIKDEIEVAETVEEVKEIIFENLGDVPAEEAIAVVVDLLGSTVEELGDVLQSSMDSEGTDEVEEEDEEEEEEEFMDSKCSKGGSRPKPVDKRGPSKKKDAKRETRDDIDLELYKKGYAAGEREKNKGTEYKHVKERYIDEEEDFVKGLEDGYKGRKPKVVPADHDPKTDSKKRKVKDSSESIQDTIEALPDEVKVRLWNDYCDDAGNSDDRIYDNAEEFFETYFISVSEAVRASLFGKYSWGDKYVVFNGYANLDTFNSPEDYDSPFLASEIADYIEENNPSWASAYDLSQEDAEMEDDE